MGRIIAVYGIIGGIVVALGMQLSIRFVSDHGTLGMVVGYLTMLVALSMVFVGVKRYRDTVHGGVIRFWPALGVGLGIAGVAGLCYVIGWEAYMYATDYGFMDVYAKQAIAEKMASGASAAEIVKFGAEMEAFKLQYANPLFRMPMTFAEIAPVGVLVALASAAILRNSRAFPAVAARS
ncbi:DUF4199 domain-containing protein [Sphingomonas sp. SUN039]|uniref:DUF4199 domain-containing protein n=1 Tax=Sphingomonas sp. SUN039 TaxID=2937787 RepID=UPI00216446F5|nr:DUF4199 domain-containing protein [Sphingomonas sp. SUN039]UVO53423.1 DUF4199 domain-containing protein [Sphingomonas sp. SUN039]